MQYKIIVDKQPMTNPSSEKKEYIIDIEELRVKGDVYDSLNIEMDRTYVTRRLSLSEYGVLSVLDEPIIEELTDLDIELFEGDNYIYLMDMQGNSFYAEYLIKNDFTDIYATKNEMNSAITQTAQSIELSVNQKLEGYSTTEEMYSAIELTSSTIMLEVNKKVGEDEFGTQIQLNYNSVQIAWNTISEYIQFTNAELQILNSSKDKLMTLNTTGQHFFDNNSIFAEMGVETVEDNRYIAFTVPCDYGEDIADGMAWGIQTTSDNKFWPILYIKNFHMANKSSGDFSGELVLTACNLSLEGINSAITCGNVRMGSDKVGITFTSQGTNENLLTIVPQNGSMYSTINILDKITFFKNQAGSNSFRIGSQNNNNCLFTDDGSIYCTYASMEKLRVENGSVQLGSTEGKISFSLYVKSLAEIYGNLEVNGNIYADNISSDKRLKENIKDSEIKGIELIKKIKHRQFEMKKDGKHYDVGYIAQELEEINKNFVMIKEKTENSEERYYINELPIIATITKAIQEQQEQIEKILNLLEVR